MYKMRLGWYAGVSAALTGSVVLFAFAQRPNFYSAMVYLAQSNFCLLVLVNFVLLIYSIFLWAMTRVFFGRLRTVEVEQLTERAWFAITETCLAMTIFRDEIGAWFLVMFTALISGKVWGWIGDGRVEILEQQPPANPRLFHLRLSLSLTISLFYDIFLFRYTINTVIQQARPNMMVMFLFEFAVLSTCSWRTGVRYLFSVAEQHIVKTQTKQRLLERRREVREQREAIIRQREQAAAGGEESSASQEPLPSEEDIDEMDIEVPGWSAKGEWVLWLDLITDMIKLGIYVAFFMMLLMFYGLPIHIIRDLFMTSRDFLKRLSALLRYRKAIQEMNRYPDATEEELAQENTCIICREEMHHWDPDNNPGQVDRVRPKKLPCGHTLHLGCLKSWLERQQVCPTCRSPVSMDRAHPGDRRVGLRIQIGGGGQQQQQPAQQNQAPAPGVNGADQRHPTPPGQQDGQQHQPEQRRNAPRIFNLGPLRFGIGANGAQLRELAQQFGGGAPPQQAGNEDVPAIAPTVTSPASQLPLTGNHLNDAASLLYQAELALQRELLSLEQRHQSLQTSHVLLAELQHLRQRQQAADRFPSGQGQPPAPNLPPPSTQNLLAALNNSQGLTPNISGASAAFGHHSGMAGYSGLPARMNSPLLGRHGTSSYTTEIQSGSPDLPEGVVIPPGWSLMPLQRLHGTQPPRQPSRQPSPQPAPHLSSSGVSGDTESFQSIADMASRSMRASQFGSQPSNTRQVDAFRGTQVAEPTPVVSPSPVIPNWGGQAQLFQSSARLDTTDSPSTALSRPDGTSRDPSQEPELRVSQVGDTEPSSTSQPPTQEGSSMAASSQASEKGKGKAVTVEEVSDDYEEETEDSDD